MKSGSPAEIKVVNESGEEMKVEVTATAGDKFHSNELSQVERDV